MCLYETISTTDFIRKHFLKVQLDSFKALGEKDGAPVWQERFERSFVHLTFVPKLLIKRKKTYRHRAPYSTVTSWVRVCACKVSLNLVSGSAECSCAHLCVNETRNVTCRTPAVAHKVPSNMRQQAGLTEACKPIQHLHGWIVKFYRYTTERQYFIIFCAVNM